MAQHVFIVGLGLIGASMALCIRQTNPELIVVGWDSQSKTREQAVEQQIVDYVASDFGTSRRYLISRSRPYNLSLS